MGQLETYRTRDIPGLDALAAWLEASKPDAQPAGVLHGDYSPFNVMASPSRPDRLAAGDVRQAAQAAATVDQLIRVAGLFARGERA